MKSYFKRSNSLDSVYIDAKQIDAYRAVLVDELKKQGAHESDIDLISDAIIINSIQRGREPKSVAWAILQ